MINSIDTRLVSAMVDKCNRLITICNKHSKSDIENNFILSDAIQFEFEKLYEDSTRLSIEIITLFPELPIDALRAIRNRVAHNYESVSLDILVDTVVKDIPVFKESLLEILEK